MDFNYFTKTIQQRGKRYFQDNRVFSITNRNNHYHAIVLGKEAYSVDLTINDNTNIVQASCNCPYASDGYRCKHEAALYYALEERLLQESNQYIDFKKKYKTFQQTTYNEYVLNNKFFDEVKNYTKKLIQINTHKPIDIIQYQKVIDDLIDINYPIRFRNQLFNLVFNTYKKLMINTDQTLTMDWIIHHFVNEKNQSYQNYFHKIMNQLSIENQNQIYQKVLKDKKYNIGLFLKYIDFLIGNQFDIFESIKNLTQYKNNELYIYYQLLDLMNHNQKEKAYQQFQQFKKEKRIKNKELECKLLSLIDDKEKDKYYLYIKSHINQYDFEEIKKYCKELKAFYRDNWIQYKYDFYSLLEDKIDTFYFKSILKENNETDVIVYVLMNQPNIYLFHAFQDVIEDKEIYSFLYVICLLEDLKNVTNASAYNTFKIHVSKLFESVTDKNARIEIAQMFINAYPKRKKLKEIMDNFLNGGEEDEIKC